jgi:hypothetical protein
MLFPDKKTEKFLQSHQRDWHRAKRQISLMGKTIPTATNDKERQAQAWQEEFDYAYHIDTTANTLRSNIIKEHEQKLHLQERTNRAFLQLLRLQCHHDDEYQRIVDDLNHQALQERQAQELALQERLAHFEDIVTLVKKQHKKARIKQWIINIFKVIAVIICFIAFYYFKTSQ